MNPESSLDPLKDCTKVREFTGLHGLYFIGMVRDAGDCGLWSG